MCTSCLCVSFVVRLTILCFVCSSWTFALSNSFLVLDSSERKKKCQNLLFSQYFRISDQLKSPSLFFITSWCWTNLEDPSKIPWILPKQSRFQVNIPAINLVSRRLNLKDPKTKSEHNMFKNTQKILVDGYYLIFEKYPQEETSFYIRNCAKKQAKV